MRKLFLRIKIRFVALMSRKQADRYFQSDGDIADVVGWFLAQNGMTPRKLSAFCYLAYAWGLAITGKEIAPFRFVKSSDGPIDLRVTRAFGLDDSLMVKLKKPEISEQEDDFLRRLYNKYRNTSGEKMMRDLKYHFPYRCAEDELGKQEIFCFYSYLLSRAM